MFRGRFVHTMDPKGRLSIPTAFRAKIQEESANPPILTSFAGCLHLYPFEDWAVVERKLADASILQTNAHALQRLFISGATECPIDNQGRILVPAYLREHAHLEREVTVAGVGRRVELWNKTRFEEDLAKTESNPDELSRLAAELGL